MLGAIFFIGTAGSGKTSLVNSYSEFLSERSVSFAIMNLDPAVVTLPYNPDIDVRNYVSITKLLQEDALGPNGAIIAAMDLVVTFLGEIIKEVNEIQADYLLVDTPGQLELFAFREVGPLLVDKLVKTPKLSVFLFDPVITQEQSGLASLLLLSASVSLRLGTPVVNVLSKADLIEEGRLEKILSVFEEPEGVIAELSSKKGLMNALASRLIENTLELANLSVPIPVSALDKRGVADLHAEIQRIFLGGESEDVGVSEQEES
ncbi:hypothetical protein B9Q11_00625 [Candidatus Marsarchaeota G2 archaeon ECH_B_SAG-F08]|uniref:GTPase n=4 Tax=Candidatus Marsarchaeota TaxID=1978152 RepID=A0A2R6BM64_9ARCH|nr:MAG: hypothetical protein B9Q01_02515 [Candidatus Marsarchaeota G1 archaeon OSP_D]PSN89297.1 MAG: hypothetical protein B9Q00_02075 [Candidatus Marsarchaeota G1 archaeon OSP_C]PSN99727.1 MAG: hypothetical protein B9Q11_00625 [Candidatus Marsarchaeota G2 archaeon ECH_B_SAG-F08]